MTPPRFQPALAVFSAEVLYNRKRPAPYVLFVLFAANAIFWQLAGPASFFGWAINSDFFIVRQFSGFAFLTLPFFTAMMMGEVVARDFRLGVDPFILSKPVSRADYLMGKFLGNFFVLVCCQSAFALAMLLAQGIRPAGVPALPVSILPYFKHFFFFVVGSHLALAAFCFAVGTLTRNVKLVYGLVTSFYLLYIAWQLVLTNFSPFWRIALDPLMLNWSGISARGQNAETLNHLIVTYNTGMMTNRALMVVVAALCLLLTYWRFAKAPRQDSANDPTPASLFSLETKVERLSIEGLSYIPEESRQLATVESKPAAALPPVRTETQTWRAQVEQFRALIGAEFRLLRSERSLVFLLPLLLFLCGIELFLLNPAGLPQTFAYAANVVKNLFFLLFGLTVFYTGETMHRDRELRIEPLLWSAPVTNRALIFSKFAAIFLLNVALFAAVALLAVVAQVSRGHLPVDVVTYFLAYSIILLPGLFFMVSAAVSLNILLRDKYLAYIVSLAIGGTLFYLFSQGKTHWSYNPLLYQLWDHVTLNRQSGALSELLLYRLYWLALTLLAILLAHLCFRRKSTKGIF